MEHPTQIHWTFHCLGLREFKQALATLPRWPRRRSLRCRCGLHHWGAWDIRLGDWRTIEKKCRRCGAVNIRRLQGRTPS